MFDLLSDLLRFDLEKLVLQVALVFPEDKKVVGGYLGLVTDHFWRLLAVWSSQQFQLGEQVGLDSRDVALDLSIERNHELSLLVIRQDVAVVAVVLDWLAKDSDILFPIRLTLELGQRILEHVWKL